MRPSLWAPALTALAVSAQQQQMPTEVHTFEIDNVFPRNETYKPADVFPIVFALQNMTAMTSIGQFTLDWHIMPFGEGHRPSGVTGDHGTFQLSGSYLLPPNNTAPSDGTTYLVAYTNTTEWIGDIHDADYRFMLQWFLGWPDFEDRCDRDTSSTLAGLPNEGSVMFNIQRTWGENGRWKGPIHDALVTTACPELGTVVEIAPNATVPECPAVQKHLEREGNPCGAKPDEAAVSSIMSHASSLAVPTSTSTTAPSSTSSAGVGPARTVQTALAAACLLCGLAL
jgi:hypothetical protein